MTSENGNILAKVEAMLFAAGEPVEASKLAEILDVDLETMTKVLSHYGALLDENNRGICLVRMNGKYQLCTREIYQDEVRRLLEVRKNTPLSQAAFEVLAIVAYNQPVTKAFIEQVRGVDCSGSVSGLVQKGLIEEKGRLDLPGRPLVYGTTDRFLRCFSLQSLDDLPPLPNENDEQTTLFDQAQDALQNSDPDTAPAEENKADGAQNE